LRLIGRRTIFCRSAVGTGNLPYAYSLLMDYHEYAITCTCGFTRVFPWVWVVYGMGNEIKTHGSRAILTPAQREWLGMPTLAACLSDLCLADRWTFRTARLDRLHFLFETFYRTLVRLWNTEWIFEIRRRRNLRSHADILRKVPKTDQTTLRL